MNEAADIIIIGAGVVGLNTALQIARRSRLKILVLEKGASLGEGSTGASSAICRFKYSRPEMVRLARDGVSAYWDWAEYLDASAPRAVFHRHGILWMSGGDGAWADAEVARLAGLGIRTVALGDDELRDRFPAINPCVLAPDLETGEPHMCLTGGRHLLELDGGFIDPVDVLQDLFDACIAAGVGIRLRTQVGGINVRGGSVSGVTLAGGGRIDCGVVVNAAGPWCNDLIASAGLDLDWPLEPTRIQVVHLNRPPALEGHIPVVCDLGAGIYFRTQNAGQQLIVSSVLEEDEKETVSDPDDFARYIDDDFTRAKLHALHHRLPALTYQGIAGYSGLYTINRTDTHPIVGKTDVAGFFVANGCSGHGFKLAPAIGSLLAQAITNQTAPGDTKVDPGFLAVDRAPIDVPTHSALA